MTRRASRAARARLAYLPDDSPFPAELSACALLDLLGSLGGLPRRERRRRAAHLLERVGLTSAARRTLGTYSRGMLRRLGLAQAFLTEPDLVLLDEPTAGLDASGYVALAELTTEARARGASIVVASHVLSDLHETCDRLAVLIDGHQVASGTPAEVLTPGALTSEAAHGMRVDGLDAAARTALASWVQEHGGSVDSLDSEPGGRVALGDLFRRLSPPESGT
jgi:ABC-2 type transport system ATP-binding protein